MERGASPISRSVPVEIAQKILSSASDAASLRNLVISSPIFYRAFNAAQNLILHSVLRNEISGGVLPTALATLESSYISSSERDQVQVFLAKDPLLPTPIPDRWSLLDLLRLSRIHGHVKYFAINFGSTLCTNVLTGIPDEDRLTLTLTEEDRIQRAFYRFEMYCNVFGKDEQNSCTFDGESQRHLFFDRFAPWENEQLLSVHEYLSRPLGIAFNDVAEHDIEWGEWNVPFIYEYMSNLDNHYKEHYLSLGLEYLHRLVTASTYDERYQLLSPQLHYDSYFDFLDAAFEEPGDYDDIPLADLTEGERAKQIKPPLERDPDIGPAEAWRWAYRRATTAYLYCQPEQRQLRKHGYVMLDYDRLCKSKVLCEPFEPAYEDPEAEVLADKKRRSKLYKSHHDRSLVWQRGGRGWWSAGDESKVVWLCGKLI